MKNIDKLKVEYIPIDQLKEYERNAKEHPEEHIRQIAASIKEFGFNDPIGIDSDNTIIEGHGRLFAARKLKLKEVPIIRLEHLTDDQKKAYIIAHNKLGQLTGFDLEILFTELESLDGDLQTLTGFNDEEISDIFNQLSEDIEAEDPKENKIGEDLEWDYVSRAGDIWIMDTHRIICEDTPDEKTVNKLLEEQKRIFHGIEFDPKYIDTSVARFIKYKQDLDEEINVKLIRDGKEYNYDETGIEEVLDVLFK